jgi:hypothetical protein
MYKNNYIFCLLSCFWRDVCTVAIMFVCLVSYFWRYLCTVAIMFVCLVSYFWRDLCTVAIMFVCFVCLVSRFWRHLCTIAMIFFCLVSVFIWSTCSSNDICLFSVMFFMLARSVYINNDIRISMLMIWHDLCTAIISVGLVSCFWCDPCAVNDVACYLQYSL